MLDAENIRLLTKLLDIKQGDKALVEKADGWKSRLILNSPLVINRGRSNMLDDYAKQETNNKRILKILTSVKSTKSLKAFKDGAKRQVEYQEMILNSRLRNASMVTSPSKSGSIKL